MNSPNANTPLKTEAECCRCPFCDQTMEMPYPFCQACGAELRRCPVCGSVLPQDTDTCAHCEGGG